LVDVIATTSDNGDVTATLHKPARKIGAYQVDPPVVLAPMAGITNVALRQLCGECDAGIYVCEMITARAVVERHPAPCT
jgi:Dihydrouridine synthase (Dus)